MVGRRFKVCILRNFASYFLIILNPSGDFDFLALKILTAHATLQKSKELKRLQSVKQLWNSTGLPDLYDHFTENSHHGRHLCFGLSIVGPSIEDISLSSPTTKTLPVHVVRKVIGSILEALNHLHCHRFVHCGRYIAHLFLQKCTPETYTYYFCSI